MRLGGGWTGQKAGRRRVEGGARAGRQRVDSGPAVAGPVVLWGRAAGRAVG